MKKLLKSIAAMCLAVPLIFGTVPVQAAEAAYFSELTGEPISTSIQAQRPIAVMIDNDKRAYPHYGLSKADIVYELMNSTANARVTRLMAVYKDWNNVPRIGNIRSTRPTNVLLAEEYNAVLVHDGGPFYINPYLAQPYSKNLSGGFSRIPNGKAVEFTEYVTSGQISSRLRSAGISASYDLYAPANINHFNFTPFGTVVNLNEKYPGAPAATKISLPYQHNSSQLIYNPATGMYDYYNFGTKVTDGDTKAVTSFKNVFIQNVSFHQYDANGYVIFNCIGQGLGYYCTNRYMVPVIWIKGGENGQTRYLDALGQEIVVNTGKTYITLCPSDVFPTITFN